MNHYEAAYETARAAYFAAEQHERDTYGRIAFESDDERIAAQRAATNARGEARDAMRSAFWDMNENTAALNA